MSVLALLIPVTLCMGATGLAAFFWSLRNAQYEDLAGDAERILFDDDVPLAPSSFSPQPVGKARETKG
jgi:cbb3-type cytochrome oxidase maturation protein